MKKIVSLLVLFASGLVNELAAQNCFNPAIFFVAANSPVSVASADFNGDGKADLAVSNSAGNNVSILLGSGTGNFSAPTNFPVGTTPFVLVEADFNGDGKADLAIANGGSNNVSVLLGTGTGAFGAATNFAVGNNPRSLRNADFDNDGDADLAVTNYFSNNVSILLNNGLGSFGPAVNFAVGTAPRSVCCADFNTDGQIDLLVSNESSNDVTLLLGNGMGVFGAAANFVVGTQPRAIVCADYSGDGNIDAATANASNNVSILIGNGAGSFAAASNFPVANLAWSITNGDFNGDGKMDLATANVNSNNVSVLIGNGLGGFGLATNYAVGNGPGTLISSELNGDARTDIAVSTAGSNNVSVLLSSYPSISVLGNNAICVGSSLTLTALGATTYSWSGGQITSSINVSPSLNVTYTVTGTNALGCISPGVISLTVNPMPLVTIAAGTTTLCIGKSNTLTASGATSYSWSTGLTTSTLIVSPVLTTTYYVIGSNIAGCSNTASLAITMYATPVLSVATTNSLICKGVQVTLIASGALNYLWNTGANTNFITVNPIVTTNYTVTGTDSYGCGAEAKFTQSVSVCSGLEEQNSTVDDFETFPNPCSNLLSVHSLSIKSGTIEILNMLGVIVLKGEIFENTSQMNLSVLKAGIYYIKLNFGSATVTKKIIKT